MNNLIENKEELFDKDLKKYIEYVERMMLNLKDRMRKEINDVLNDSYVEITSHVYGDTLVNFRNTLKDELSSDLKKEILDDTDKFTYSWAANFRLDLLENNKEKLQNSIINTLLLKIESLESIISSMRR